MPARSWRAAAAVVLLSIAGGCAGGPVDRRSPATVAGRPPGPVPGAPSPSPAPAPGPAPEPDAASAHPEPPSGSISREAAPAGDNPAVVALLDAAGKRSRAGRLDEAAAALERALRIEPANAEVWARLAAVRLDQGQPRPAEALALKALALSGPGEGAFRARCHRLVARARRAQGDEAGARAAEARAAEEGGR